MKPRKGQLWWLRRFEEEPRMIVKVMHDYGDGTWCVLVVAALTGSDDGIRDGVGITHFEHEVDMDTERIVTGLRDALIKERVKRFDVEGEAMELRGQLDNVS
jgi:hypothetical protein